MKLPTREIRAAAHAWQIGGSQALGWWFARNKRRLDLLDYGAIVVAVRQELNDITDYSKYNDNG